MNTAAELMRILRSAKILLFACALSACFCGVLSAEELSSGTPGVTSTATELPKKIVRMAASKAEDAVEMMKTQKTDMAEIKTQYDTFKAGMEQSGKKIEEMGKTLAGLRDDLNSLEEKNTELSGVAAEMEALKTGLKDMSLKIEKDKVVTDKYIDEFSEMKSTIREKVDKLQSYSDIMDVLKKELNNNEIEIARLKKEISLVRAEYGGDDNALDTISRWPYMGVTALALSLVAFIVVMVKK